MKSNVSWIQLVREPWFVLVGACILWLGVQSAALSPLTPILISQVGGLDKSQVTIFFLINILVGIGLNLTAGWLSDGKVSRVLIIVVSGISSVLGNIGLSQGGPPWLLYVYAVLTASGFILFSQLFAVAHSALMKSWSKGRKVLGTTVLRTAFSLGFVVGTGLASLLLLVLPLQALYFTMALSAALMTLVSALVVRRVEAWSRAQSPLAQKASEDPVVEKVPVISWGALVLPLAAMALMQGSDRIRMVYMPLVTFELFHDARWSPMMFGITAATELFTLVAVGMLAVRWGERWTIFAGALVGAACFVAMAVFPTLPAMFAANFVYSLFIAALAGVAMAYIQGLLSHRPGLGGSLFLLTSNLGALIGIFAPLLVPGYSPAIFFLPALLCTAGAGLLLSGRAQPEVAKTAS